MNNSATATPATNEELFVDALQKRDELNSRVTELKRQQAKEQDEMLELLERLQEVQATRCETDYALHLAYGQLGEANISVNIYSERIAAAKTTQQD